MTTAASSGPARDVGPRHRVAARLRPLMARPRRARRGGGRSVVIPQAMAYASIADLPTEVGLYTCMVPMVVYALLGGSRTLSVSTTSTVAVLTGSTLLAANVAADSSDPARDLAMLTLLVGVILVGAGVLHLGALVDNISEATLTGIKIGVGLTVAAGQLPKLLGIESATRAGRPWPCPWRPSSCCSACPGSSRSCPAAPSRSPSCASSRQRPSPGPCGAPTSPDRQRPGAGGQRPVVPARSFFRAMPSAGGFSQTAINQRARTQLSELVGDRRGAEPGPDHRRDPHARHAEGRARTARRSPPDGSSASSSSA